jgi:hypothetical protein
MPAAIVRLFTSGMRDADARFDRALAPRAAQPADEYLASSVTIRTIDRLLQRWSSTWPSSKTHAVLTALGMERNSAWQQRYGSIGWMLVTAAGTHVAVTLAQGARPGWYWIVIPSMAMGFGALLLTAARSASRS